MEFKAVMTELEKLGQERLKKMYIGRGAKEPLFGVATGKMKPMSKIIKRNQELAEKLYETGNYDAMYFAGVIADPMKMTKDDFERWIKQAYFFMISDFIVAVTLSETNFAQEVCDEWITSNNEYKASAGWSCYCWLLGSREDKEFSEEKMSNLLDLVKNTISKVPKHVKLSMKNYIYTVATSYVPLREKALEMASKMRNLAKDNIGTEISLYDRICKDVIRNPHGFKRKYVRC